MSAPSRTHTDETLSQTIQKEQTSLLKDFPELATDIQQILKRTTFATKVSLESLPKQQAKSLLTQEELATILKKLQEIIELPNTSLDTETLLYLEQQLTEVLNFDISRKLADVELPFLKANITALPELKMGPHKKQVTFVEEAGAAADRSYFGWDTQADFESDTTAQPFWVAVPTELIKTQADIATDQKNWWKNKKLVLINCVDAIAVTALVKDDFLDASGKYQLGASPAVIREGSFWSPLNLGRCLVYFVDDPQNNVQLGTYTLYS